MLRTLIEAGSSVQITDDCEFRFDRSPTFRTLGTNTELLFPVSFSHPQSDERHCTTHAGRQRQTLTLLDSYSIRTSGFFLSWTAAGPRRSSMSARHIGHSGLASWARLPTSTGHRSTRQHPLWISSLHWLWPNRIPGRFPVPEGLVLALWSCSLAGKSVRRI